MGVLSNLKRAGGCSGGIAIYSARPIKMNLDLNSADDRRSAEGFGQIAAQNLIRPLRILGSAPIQRGGSNSRGQ